VAAVGDRAAADVGSDERDHRADAIALSALTAERDDRNAHLVLLQRGRLLHRREHGPIDAERSEDAVVPAERSQVFVHGRRVDGTLG
jgi:hypothetical protein